MAIPVCTLSVVLTLVICLLVLVNLEGNYREPIGPWLEFAGAPKSRFWIQHLGFLLSFTMLPLWWWVISEYRSGTKVPVFDSWPMWIEPMLSTGIMFLSLVNRTTFESVDGYQASKSLGSYSGFHRLYMIVGGFLILVWSINAIRVRSQRSTRDLMQFGACLAAPIYLFLAYKEGVLPLPVGAPALVLLLAWAARQSSLLDVIPFALKGVVEKVGAGIVVLNAQDSVVYANSFAYELLGYPSTKNSDDLPQRSTFTILQKYFDLDKRQKQSSLIEVDAQSSGSNSESKSYIDATLTPLFNDKTKQFLGKIVLLQDVSKREIAELALEKANHELQQLHRQKLDFFANISHEFRTPLTLIRGSVTDLQNNVDSHQIDGQNNQLNLIKSNNDRLLHLVSQLLDLSKLEVGATSLTISRISLERYLPMIVANFESLASRQTTRVHVSCTGEDSVIAFDIDALDKVLLNLLSNAFKSIRDHGDIYISVFDLDDQKLQLSVKDTGHGIPADVLPRIFEPFYSHEVSHDFWPQGSGVGLSLVKKLLHLHDADIEVRSSPGKGSEFRITLPRAAVNNNESVFPVDTSHDNIRRIGGEGITDPRLIQDHLSATYATSDLIKPRSESGPTEKLVLIVDDNPQMRNYIRRHLGSEFRLIEAGDGEEGLELARQSVPDLVLSDYMMPNKDGLELCTHLKQSIETSHIPVLMLTARAGSEDRIKSLQQGVDDFLTKPFEIDELLARIHNLIESRIHLKAHYQRRAAEGEAETFANDDLKIEAETGRSTEQASLEISARETGFLLALREYVVTNLSTTDIRTLDLANAVHISERSLNRKLKALTDQTPKQFLLSIRLQCAKQKLLATQEPITEIAHSTGFADASYFSRAFKGRFLATPMDYRNRALAKN